MRIEKNISLYSYCFPIAEESIEQRHAEIAANMRQFGPPFGWAGLVVPPAPDCGDGLCAVFQLKYPVPGLRFSGEYSYRDREYLEDDHTSLDDKFNISFKAGNRRLDYRAILHEHYPKVVWAVRAYRAETFFAGYTVQYEEEHSAEYQKARSDESVNGRNNIFTLGPAMYWDALLCRRAMGFGPEEVIRRLQGKVPRVMPLMDGIYTVFSDDPDLSFAEFVAINDRFKPILGLI